MIAILNIQVEEARLTCNSLHVLVFTSNMCDFQMYMCDMCVPTKYTCTNIVQSHCNLQEYYYLAKKKKKKGKGYQKGMTSEPRK